MAWEEYSGPDGGGFLVRHWSTGQRATHAHIKKGSKKVQSDFYQYGLNSIRRGESSSTGDGYGALHAQGQELSHKVLCERQKHGTHIIGSNACEKLALIKRVDALATLVTKEKPLEEYADVFTGKEYDIELDSNVSPTVQQPRPYRMRNFRS